MITFACSACPRTLRVEDSLSGKMVRCPACKERLAIPATAGEGVTLPPAPPPDADATLPPAAPDPAATLAPAVPAGPRDERAPPGYEVLGELGRGGMGVVYRARHLKLNRVVALKMILSGAHAGSDEMARFRTEAEAIARLQHPGIVAVHEISEHDGRPYFSLEFCSGGSLEKKLGGTPMQPKEAAGLVRSLAEAMQAAHEAKVIHRDLKPANVLLTGAGSVSDGPPKSVADASGSWGTPKVTDFGLAKKLDEQSDTVSGSVMGTPSYMAPEQAEGKKDVGPPADIYSLGAILYECLTGRPPFRAATAFDTVLQVVSEEPVPPRQLNAKVPRDLETVILKCLAKEPAKRYASARELGDDLGRFLAGEPIKARPIGAIGRGVKWVRRNPAVAALLALVFVALAAGTTVSTLFALDASKKAGQLAEQAEDLKKERNTAQQQERQTAAALEEAEATLIGGLIRPIGRSWGLPDAQGRQEGRLDSLELEAVGELRAVRSDRVRLRFLEKSLSDARTAERIGWRAELVIRGVVGLDAEQRLRAERLVVRGIRKENSSEIRLACALLGLELNVTDPEWTRQAAEVLIAYSRWQHPAWARWVTTPSASLTKEQAERNSASAVAFLVNGLCNMHFSLGEGMANELEAIDGPVSPKDASQAAKVLTEAIANSATPSWSAHLNSRVRGLKSVSARLGAAEAAGHAACAAEAIAVAMENAQNPQDVPFLGLGLILLGESLDAKGAVKVAEILATAIKKPALSAEQMVALATSLAAVTQRLGTKEAAGYAAIAVDRLLPPALDPTTNKFFLAGNYFSGLESVSKQLDTKDATAAADKITAVMARTKDPGILSSLARALVSVCRPLDADEASRHAARAAAILAARIEPNSISYMARGLRAIGPLLEARGAARAADALTATLGKGTKSVPLSDITLALNAVYGRLEAPEAARHASSLADAMLAAIAFDKNPESGTFNSLDEGLAAFGEHLGPKEARKAAESILRAMERIVESKSHFFALRPLAQALVGAVRRLEPLESTKYATRLAALLLGLANNMETGSLQRDEVGRILVAVGGQLGVEAAGKVAEALLPALSSSDAEHIRDRLERALTVVAAQCGIAELIHLLRQPLCVGRAERAVLSALGRRYKREFRNGWHFIDWAASNGVDWLAATKTDAP